MLRPWMMTELVRSALEPAIEERLKQARSREEQEQALLSIKIVDPACGSGHFLLAAARQLGKELACTEQGKKNLPRRGTGEAIRDIPLYLRRG